MSQQCFSDKRCDLTCLCACVQPSYVGPVIVSIECNLADAAGNELGVPLKAIKFQVRDHVAVRATAYKIGAHQLGNA